jgi:predicted histone-like DNA-binding protein
MPTAAALISRMSGIAESEVYEVIRQIMYQTAQKRERRILMIHYNVIERRNPSDPTQPNKYYGIVKSLDVYQMHQFASRISDESTLSEADINAAITAFLKTIPKVISEGFIVDLGEFGTFRASISTEGVDAADEFNNTKIKKCRIIYHPGELMRDSISTFKFTKNVSPTEPASTP